MTALDELRQAPNLRELLDQPEQTWQDEHRRRHEFWADADDGKVYCNSFTTALVCSRQTRQTLRPR